MEVLIKNQQRRKIDSRRMKSWAEMALKRLGRDGAELSVLLVDDEAMKALNGKYRGLHEATNVLAFPMMDDLPQGGGMEMLGDVVISVETAEREAKLAGRDTEAHLLYLLVHGLLHLLGYDHEASRAEEREMRSLQDSLCEGLLGGAKGCDGPLKGERGVRWR